MISRFFINRPIFAAVISIVIVLAGAVAAPTLPIAQYPDITPPLIQITAKYPGATGEVVSDTVATPIEQQVNGVDDMLYMESFATADGSMTLNVTFDVGTNPNMDQVLAQNRVAMAMPQMPDVVQRQGVVTRKTSPSILMAINLFSPDERYDAIFLSNYLKIQIYDELLKIPGVGQVNIGGARDYSMRLWLDPDRLAARNLSALDVVAAVQEQNVQVAAGMLGSPPTPPGQDGVYLLSTEGRLTDVKQFEQIIVQVVDDGSLVRLRDVGRVELGAQTYVQNTYLDNKPSVVAAVFQLPGSNALDTADAVRKKMEELKTRFPKGLEYATYYDTTAFIRDSAVEVFWTLIESTFLVSLVIFIFLQSWRTAIIPITSLPVSIIGAFAIMAAFGFSFNNLSLFGLVLAIGIVVDDAIVVVENIERNLEMGLPPKEAALRAMEEISGAVVAMTLVLSCVFIPSAFISGISGQFYRQFALTIAGSTLISGLNSLTLSPALCAMLLKQRKHGEPVRPADILPIPVYALGFAMIGAAIALSVWGGTPMEFIIPRVVFDGLTKHATDHSIALAVGGAVIGAVVGIPLGMLCNQVLARFFVLFNRTFSAGTSLYGAVVHKIVRLSLVALVVYGGLLWATERMLVTVPMGFIPEMDKGYILVNVKLPDGASLERTDAVVRRLSDICREIPGVGHTLSYAGYSMVVQSVSTSSGTVICPLEDFEHRHDIKLRADNIIRQLRPKLAAIRDAVAIPFGAPAVEGLGTGGGFKLQVQDRGNLGPEELAASVQRLVRAGNAQSSLRGLTTTYTANLPQIYLDIDRTQAKVLGVNLSDIFQTLQVYVGSLYINDINLFGRTWQVQAQAEAAYRLTEEDVPRIRIRSKSGEMVPLGSVVTLRHVTGPEKVNRYNMFRSAEIMGSPAPGSSSGEAIRTMEALAKRELPASMSIAWTDLYFQQIKAGNTAVYVFIFATIMVFLVLAAQYESWSLPLAVVLIVPMCVLCAMVGVWLRGFDNNIFTQVGLLVLVGLSCKNAILIVEFARQQYLSGQPLFESTVEASRTRLRPILMTSACFVHMVPLYFAVGAGAEMRQALGTAVLFGVFGVTMFGVFFTPVFFYVIEYFGSRKAKGTKPTTVADVNPEPPPPVH